MILENLLQDALPDDHSRQVNSEQMLNQFLDQKSDLDIRVLDLGCGNGRSIDLFKSKSKNIKWIGVDIDSSPEVDSRMRTDGEFLTFDGIHLPFEDNYFDLIYSNQVFEHVRHPEKLLKDVFRVLKPGASFIGSVSHLEPFHSYSYWNYTPYGFKVLAEDAGLTLKKIRPSIDSLTLIIRSGLRVKAASSLDRYWIYESPLNKLISFFSRLKKYHNSRINVMKLSLCGQFCFQIIKED
ncbi:MAG: class I SAM-dependent methyltransferase [Limnothrix sp. RL_2_0]|nr:class I SAM-dependent methyltransferase [Limnothrix sp. RL_2_0]